MNRLYASLLVAGLALAAVACSAGDGIPDVLEPADESLALVAPASGVQIYECGVRADGYGDRYEWTLVGPEATLYDGHGHAIGSHFAGPYWQATDGSRVVGGVSARVKAPVTGAIPWQLVTTKSDGPAGSFSNVTSIQRVNTSGGLPPANPCNGGTVGRRIPVRYSAEYRFFVAPSARRSRDR